MSEDNNPREELYRRFRESLSRPVAERFFDEDELVEVYDYAGDISDDYVQLEALFCGARLYPESVPLAERRALMYLDTSIDDSDRPSPAAGEFLDDNVDNLTPIFDIARLQVNRPADPVAALEFLLNQYDSFGDEEMIRFLDLAFDMDLYDWVKTNLPRLRKKVRYLPVLLFEILREAEQMRDNELAIAMAEELIEQEPFSAGYWLALFTAQARFGKEEDARNSFEYTKALGADEPDILLALGEAAFNYAPYLASDVFEMIKTLSMENPDKFVYLDCLCSMLAHAGAGSKALSLLREFLKTHPSDVRAMRQFLLCNPYDAEQVLTQFYDAPGSGGFDTETYVELVHTLSMNGAGRSLSALLKAGARYGKVEPADFCSWFEALFCMEHYSEVIELYRAYMALPEGPDFVDAALRIPLKGPSAMFAIVVSLMKAGAQDEVDTLWQAYRPYYENLLGEVPMPVRMNLRCLFTLMDKVRRHPASEKLYWYYFDMLAVSKF